MAAELIGRCRCPLCRSDKARLTLAKSGLPVLTCNGCNFQGFARSDRSDEALRAMLVKDPAPEPAPAPEPKKPDQEEINRAAQAAANRQAAISQTMAIANQKPEPEAKRPMGWGAFPFL